MNQKWLQMRGISKFFPGVKALEDVDFSVDRGEVVALLGENGAGKSTLMNVLGGIYRADGGEILINSQPVSIRSASDAQRLGIAFIHQELSLFKQLPIYENMFIDNLVRRRGFPLFIDRRSMKKRAAQMLEELGVKLDVNRPVGSLPVSQQQIVEIAGALLKDVGVIILDEPSTSLANHEREKLYELVRKLRRDGKAVIYITHDLDVAIQLCDRAVVLRDGKNAGDRSCAELTKQDVIQMMIGSSSGKSFHKSERSPDPSDIVLEVSHMNSQKVFDVSLELRRGEVLGLYGLVGSGRTELIQAIYGLDRTAVGEVRVEGNLLRKRNPVTMKRSGIGYLTENRRDEGLFLTLGIDRNITITDIGKILSGPFNHVSRKKSDQIALDTIERLRIRTPGPHQAAGKLSGGNQQKVIIGKWLHLDPRILILDEPTKGIDVGAKEEIYKLINSLVDNGISVLLISSEIEEIMGLSDRIQVMCDGRISESLDAATADQQTILRYTMGDRRELVS
ncbi:sugar ABC transporter ATP-binding protein [Feifania hominis]|uniref:Sugar ABC transporter ATP-binding protein n=1 Tax=Feifania hominis TaxID=2763660 RepID=A0A926DFN3_9FIRM|nr:sugar ABC transporter ATP-binding protein [Feifania hominis]MBC8536962.1 sugar ABC transporter ATP-binding protein [Feifania hominis]